MNSDGIGTTVLIALIDNNVVVRYHDQRNAEDAERLRILLSQNVPLVAMLDPGLAISAVYEYERLKLDYVQELRREQSFSDFEHEIYNQDFIMRWRGEEKDLATERRWYPEIDFAQLRIDLEESLTEKKPPNFKAKPEPYRGYFNKRGRRRNY